MGHSENRAIYLYQKVTDCKELVELEKAGFLRGAKKGKTMNVSYEDLVTSLDKQYADFLKAFGKRDVEATLRTLADLRNVAGCCFLKLVKP